MIRIYPAIMGIEQVGIQNMAKLKGLIDCIHIDVMDGIFVPNITQGENYITEFVKKEGLYAWVHLMIQDILRFYESCELPTGSLVSFHLESQNDIFEIIKTIKEKKHVPSVAINPKTPVSDLFPFLDVIDHILLMSVEPGSSGQLFLPEVLKKIEVLVEYRKLHGLRFRIGVDGGINKTNIGELVKRGADDLAIATGIFGEADPVVALRRLYEIIKNH